MTETNPARAAARLPIAPSPYPSGLLRFAISSREPRPRPGWRRPASRAPARPCPAQPAPCRPPADGVHAPSAWRPLRFARSRSRRFCSFSKARAAFRSAALSTGREEGFFAFGPFDLRAAFVGPPPPRSVGSSACSLKDRFGSNRAPENDAGLCHGRSDDVRIVAFLRRALVEEIAVGAPRFQSRFHRGSRDRQIEEAQRGLVGLQFSRHETLPRTAH